MGKFLTAMCIVLGWTVLFFIVLCFAPALIPISPLIAFCFLVWLVWKLLKGC